MKRALNIVLFLGFCVAYAQEKKGAVYSVYFSEQSLAALKQVPVINSTFFSKYQLEETEENAMRNAAGEYLHVDATGVYFEKNKLLSITREQVREEGKYQVK